MKETLRQLTPEQLVGVQGGGGDGQTKRCQEGDDDALAVRTRRCAC